MKAANESVAVSMREIWREVIEFDRPSIFGFRKIEFIKSDELPVHVGCILVDGQLKQDVFADEFHAEAGMTEFSVRGVRMGACDEEGTEGNHGYLPAIRRNGWVVSTGGQMLLV